ncbi:MAG: glutathionylspermidine synthase family protein [Eggerthellaceae bacterium]|nr:glutathionylspermidine synthase family protein [Eggerthellaceae bacterium]
MDTELSSDAYTREYLALLDASGTDEADRRSAWRFAEQSDAYWQGHPSYIGYLPRLYGKKMRERFAYVGKTAYGIVTKVMDHFVNDPEYRNEFCFDPRVVELILLPRSYTEPLPLARIDFFYDEENDTVRFCEFNADASSGMEESRVAREAIRSCAAYKAFESAHEVYDDFDVLYEGWVRTFLDIYREAKDTRKSTQDETEEHLAIAVCFDSPDPEFGELERYRTLFMAAGMPCSIFDVRELAYEDGRLVGHKALSGESNVTITCVWRYCIMVDLLEHWDEVGSFLDAIRNDAAVMIGSFATHLVHDKQLFAVLHSPATSAFLTEEERAFVKASVPFTAFLDDTALDLESIKRDPSAWIIKPTDWYSSINVHAGADHDATSWAELLDRCVEASRASRAQGSVHDAQAGSPFILQAFCTPYRTPAIPLYGREEDFTAPPRMYGNLLGAYMFAGNFAGMFSRLGPNPIITEAQGGTTAPTLWVKE